MPVSCAWQATRPCGFRENSLTTYHNRWLNFLYSCSAAFLD
jgi:hypothetical protein